MIPTQFLEGALEDLQVTGQLFLILKKYQWIASLFPIFPIAYSLPDFAELLLKRIHPLLY